MKLSANPRAELETARQQYERLCELFTRTAEADFAAAERVLEEMQGLGERIAALEAEEGPPAPAPAVVAAPVAAPTPSPPAAAEPAPAAAEPAPTGAEPAPAAATAQVGRPAPTTRTAAQTRRAPRRLLLAVLVGAAIAATAYQIALQLEGERRALLRQNLQEQGRLLALALEPELRQDDPSPLWTLPDRLQRFAAPDTRITVLFRPQGQQGASSFYLVVAVPTPPPALFEEQRRELMRQGLLDAIADTCSANLPLVSRRSDGGAEALVAVTPVQSAAGCWAVILSKPLGGLLRGLLGLSGATPAPGPVGAVAPASGAVAAGQVA